MTNQERKERIAEIKDELSKLELECTHEITNDNDNARCTICDHEYGWYCPSSPDYSCYYFSSRRKEQNVIDMLDGSEFIIVNPDHNPDLESEDQCLFCGLPQERK